MANLLPELSKIKQKTELTALSTAQLKELQQALNGLYYPCGDVDGIFGQKTEKAYYDYKKDRYLGYLSYIGIGTITKLKEELRNVGDYDGRKINQAGINLIKEFEGLRLIAYLCSANVATIGYGSTYYPNGQKVKLGDSITRDEAEELLKVTVKGFEEAVSKAVTVPLNDNQFAALVSFVFNIGKNAFRNSTLLKELNRGNYNQASNELLRWDKAGGRSLAGLARRRQAERKLFVTFSN